MRFDPILLDLPSQGVSLEGLQLEENSASANSDRHKYNFWNSHIYVA